MAADSVFLLAVFGMGMGRSLPPDLTVEPARFLRRLATTIRKRKDIPDLRIVARLRVPAGEVDADEVRLLLAPRNALRGFTCIEVGVTYAIGLGARVAMPEVLVRVLSGSRCDEALRTVARMGRVTPGRKRGERVLCLAPRFPTVKMTAEIAAALAIRVVDRTSSQKSESKKRTKRSGPAASKAA
jgi:hypothetical protein